VIELSGGPGGATPVQPATERSATGLYRAKTRSR
jgi:hypothetical protein